MSRSSLNQALLIALAIGVLWPCHSSAQTLPATWTAGSGSTAVDFELRADGTLIEKGAASSGTLTNTDLQSASHFIWYPALSAMRVGAGYSGSETVSGMGQYSMVLGSYSTAAGFGAMALGFSSTASGSESIAGGGGTASGPGSVALGSACSATGSDSIALGMFEYASGANSIALGIFGSASGTGAVALGFGSASGPESTTMGFGAAASGTYSTSTGYYTSANAYDSFTIGTYNVGLSETGGTPSLTTWASTDPLFEIGNGTSSTKSDALVVYKDGSAKFSGPVQVPQSGDIPMYHP